MADLKSLLKKITPPIIVDSIRSLRPQKKPSAVWSGVYDSFKDVEFKDDVWSSEEWVKVAEEKLVSAINGHGFSKENIGLLINEINTIMAYNNKCTVLDFAGGAGYIYYFIFNRINNNSKLYYKVYDNNKITTSMGEAFRKSQHNIEFLNNYRDISKYDILYINSSLQYIENYIFLFDGLLEGDPQTIILSRLVAGDIETFVTVQNILGHKFPAIFINLVKLDNYLKSKNYICTLKEKNLGEPVRGYADNIDRKYQIDYSLNVIYKKKPLN